MNQEQAHPQGTTSSRLVVTAAVRTDVGRVRAENQDFAAATSAEEEASAGLSGRLLVVADGMGGHRGGATASRLAAETVKSEYLESASGDVPRVLRDSLLRANDRIFTEAKANPDLRGMGTTASALVVRGSQAWIGHVGDSRIYLVRGSDVRQLTEDHSLVAALVKEGLISPEEAETHPRRNVLQRSLGVGSDVEVDVTGPFEVEAGDIFVLCSDGLHGLVKNPEIAEVARLPIEEAADEFLKRALERGAPDNVTVIVARADADESRAEEAGEDTFDDTQPFDATDVDSSLFDETIVEGRRPPKAAPVVPDDTPIAPAVAGQSPAPAPDAASAPEPQPARSGFPKWLLILFLLACAGAVWFAAGHPSRLVPAAAGTSR